MESLGGVWGYLSATARTIIPKTMDMFKVKNGIWLTMNPGEHSGWVIVDPGPLTQAEISYVTIARAVIREKKVDCREKGEFSNYSSTIQLATSKPIHRYEKGPWLNDLCKHES